MHAKNTCFTVLRTPFQGFSFFSFNLSSRPNNNNDNNNSKAGSSPVYSVMF